MAVNERLKLVGVPFVTFELDAAGAAGNLARFRFQAWTVPLDPPRSEVGPTSIVTM